MSDKWIESYSKNKSAIWIRCTLSNGEELFYDKFDGWLKLKDKCEKEKIFFNTLSLQFKSHKLDLDVKDCDAIYLIRSILGQIGSDTRNYYTIGKVRGDKVSKQMILVPELIVDKEFEENVSECFSEAIIYNETSANRKK